MNDADLLKLMTSLGIDNESMHVLTLLPLLSVAWADGELQPAERELIDQHAKALPLGEEGERVLQTWLRWAPSPVNVERGLLVLRALTCHQGQLKLEPAVLELARERSLAVAKAAGGLWGFGAVDRDEKAALARIETALDPRGGWEEADQLLAAAIAALPKRTRVLLQVDTDTLDLGGRLAGVLLPGSSDDVRIPIDGALTVGSSTEAHVGISDRRTDALHAQLRRANHRFYVRDLDSSSGTWVDGDRVIERRLFGGETLRLGAAELRFKLLRRVPRQMLDVS